MAQDSLKELIDTVMVYCNPSGDCNDPEVLKTYMRGCYDKAEEIYEMEFADGTESLKENT